MTASAPEWNAKYRAEAEKSPPEPAGFVRELLPLLPLGPALDLACGTGRHTVLLASRHQPVTAVDSSAVALEILERRAHASHCEVTRMERAAQGANRRHGIQLWQADLEEVSLPAQAFPLVLCVNYLQRSLFSQIERTLVPGGVVLFETYTLAQLEFPGGPRNTNYLLEPGELRTAFPALRILFYRELRAGKGIASLIAQKPK
ncbi:MAG TPA: class I SAM-dependent methyltransferase [Candidatus Acidoferrum sp.]|nr:class I SAM-dependent methyltransferase [Candidatus Acidoferrum sp.]